jgi:hypothetical protein
MPDRLSVVYMLVGRGAAHAKVLRERNSLHDAAPRHGPRVADQHVETKAIALAISSGSQKLTVRTVLSRSQVVCTSYIVVSVRGVEGAW